MAVHPQHYPPQVQQDGSILSEEDKRFLRRDVTQRAEVPPERRGSSGETRFLRRDEVPPERRYSEILREKRVVSSGQILGDTQRDVFPPERYSEILGDTQRDVFPPERYSERCISSGEILGDTRRDVFPPERYSEILGDTQRDVFPPDRYSEILGEMYFLRTDTQRYSERCISSGQILRDTRRYSERCISSGEMSLKEKSSVSSGAMSL
ncbi:hypothetical protein KUCAC02_031989 [Chaenocephalus aceratus]|nr:hypothetical protein KUCAC02_031989 [Chaenocephalus aceratus]